jgi:hypothetical protein
VLVEAARRESARARIDLAERGGFEPPVEV